MLKYVKSQDQQVLSLVFRVLNVAFPAAHNDFNHPLETKT